ncbi:Transposase [Pseudomonas fluorescens]|uniref:Transposase n=1 Tax=Pseudomonas fluorescens TaxID=294 RepID=A0A0D0RVM2_PSEFL|nr:Transposase [Pseudomonas fluorescens]
MSNPRYPEEFKIQAVNQVIEKKLPVAGVAARLGVSTHSLYAWIKRYSKPQEERQQDDDQHAELRHLRAELKCVTEERDILKKPPRTLPRSAVEVRLYQTASRRLLHSTALPDAESPSQWLLRLVV